MGQRATARAEKALPAREEDDVIHLHGVSWADYERILAVRGDRSAPRISYADGVLEIMAPSRNHEDIKSRIGRLVEAYCFERNIPFTALGSWTLKKKSAKRGAEPDECYQLGPGDPQRHPELAIEVEWTSGRIDKLDVHRKLGVRELWYWQEGVIVPYRLHGERYKRARASKALPGLDLKELASFLDHGTTYDAVRAYRATLAAR
jgi:Uma2 family endonuclease